MLGSLAEIEIQPYLLVAAISFVASVVGGIAGYGTGLLLPPVLLPIVGPEAVVPIISLSALLTNGSRLLVFLREFHARYALLIVIFAVPTCVAGAYGYTALTGTGASLVIGLALIILVPLRYLALRAHWTLKTPGLAAAGSGYGFLVGATSGSGVVLLSILMAGGLQGSAVIATDAGISLLMGIVKVVVFQSAGVLPLSAWVMAAVIGICATPGAFLAKRLTRYLPMHIHTRILDGVVIFAGSLLIIEAFR